MSTCSYKRVTTEQLRQHTWKNSSCFSGLQKNGCLSTQAVEGRDSTSALIICSIRSCAMTSSNKTSKYKCFPVSNMWCDLSTVYKRGQSKHQFHAGNWKNCSQKHLWTDEPIQSLVAKRCSRMKAWTVFHFHIIGPTKERGTSERHSPCKSSIKCESEYSPDRMLTCLLSASPKGCCPLLIT